MVSPMYGARGACCLTVTPVTQATGYTLSAMLFPNFMDLGTETQILQDIAVTFALIVIASWGLNKLPVGL